ncbi:hypothetical protein D3C84_126090 [compost metagenome]
MRLLQFGLPLQLLQLHGQAVMALLQQGGQRGGMAEAPVHQAFVQGLQLMGEVADRTDFGHPCATLEGVQITLQGRERSLVVRFGTPALQRLTGTFEDVHGLLEKDLDHLCIERLITRGRARGCSRLGLDQDAGVLIDLQLNCRSRLALVLLRPGHLLERRSGGIQLDDLQARLTLRGQQGQGPRIQCLCEQTTQRLDPRRLGADLQAGSHLIHHADQGFMRLFGLTEETLADRQAALFHRTIKVEQGFTELIDLRQLGHLRAAPQSRQFIQQGAQFLTLGRMLAPALQQRLGI